LLLYKHSRTGLIVINAVMCAAICCALLMSLAHAQVVGDRAKLNHLELFDGSKFEPKSIEGKPTLIYFWASWCPICYSEMPNIEKHYRAFKDKGFNVLGINFRDKRENAIAMLERVKPITFPVGIINDDWRSDYPRIHGTPTWFLLDQQGVIRKVVVGKQTITGGWLDGLKGEVEKLLPRPEAANTTAVSNTQ
jgi:thiol-disulfide isomerase/thioredoxin